MEVQEWALLFVSPTFSVCAWVDCAIRVARAGGAYKPGGRAGSVACKSARAKKRLKIGWGDANGGVTPTRDREMCGALAAQEVLRETEQTRNGNRGPQK